MRLQTHKTSLEDSLSLSKPSFNHGQLFSQQLKSYCQLLQDPYHSRLATPSRARFHLTSRHSIAFAPPPNIVNFSKARIRSHLFFGVGLLTNTRCSFTSPRKSLSLDRPRRAETNALPPPTFLSSASLHPFTLVSRNAVTSNARTRLRSDHVMSSTAPSLYLVWKCMQSQSLARGVETAFTSSRLLFIVQRFSNLASAHQLRRTKRRRALRTS